MFYNKNEIVTRVCPICDNIQREKIFAQKFAFIQGISFLDGYDVVACRDCGFIFADNIPGQKVFDYYYSTANKYENNFIYLDNSRYIRFIDSVISSLPELSTEFSIADIGCGQGQVLSILHDRGFTKLKAFDPSQKNIEHLRAMGISGECSSVFDISGEQKFDLVFCLSCLEHIEDLQSAVQVLANCVDTDRFLVVAVPDLKNPNISGGYPPFQEFSIEHINYFTLVSLDNLVAMVGFRPVQYLQFSPHELVIIYKHGTPTKWIYDSKGREAINDYIAYCNTLEKKLYQSLEKDLKEPVIIWGIGTFTLRMLARLKPTKLMALVDSAYGGTKTSYNGVSVISPEDLKQSVYYNIPILICTSAKYIQEITSTIRQNLKLTNPISSIDYNAILI